MKTVRDVLEFRKSPEALEFAERWIEAQRAHEVTSDWHMNLSFWTLDHPFHVLGIVLNLIDLTIDDESDTISEMVALGPVEWLVENSPKEFYPVLREAVRLHPGLALFTSGRRESSDKPRWANLSPGR